MDNNLNQNNAGELEHVEQSEAAQTKRKVRGYALVRVIMMSVFALAFAVFVTITIAYKDRDIRAKNKTEQIMSGFNEITYNGTVPTNTDPIIIPSATPESTDPKVESTPDAESTPNVEMTTPEETEPPVDPEYQEYISKLIAEAKAMKEQYPDFVGIISINGDVIDMKCPFFQGKNNQYYVNHLYDGSLNSTGEIFLDTRNNRELLKNKNNVLYGHNMNDGTKFGQIKFYKYSTVFYTHNIVITTPECVMTFKPFSYYQTHLYAEYIDVNFANKAEFASFCMSEQQKSKFESNYNFTGEECIITLSTCYGTSETERHCVHAVLVDISK